MASSAEVHPNWLGHGQPETMEGWFRAVLFDTDLDCFGGYPGEAVWFDEVIVVSDPGLESNEYGSTKYYDRQAVEDIFHKYAHLDPARDEAYDVLDDVYDAELSVDQVNVTKRQTAPEEP